MASFRGFITTALLFGLFLVSIIMFGSQLAIDNESNNSILNNPNINATMITMSTNLTNTQDVAEDQSASQDETLPIAVFDFLFESIIGTVKIFKGTASLVYNLTLGLLVSELGVPPIVLATFTAIILITLVFLGWRNFKTGT